MSRTDLKIDERFEAYMLAAGEDGVFDTAGVIRNLIKTAFIAGMSAGMDAAKEIREGES